MKTKELDILKKYLKREIKDLKKAEKFEIQCFAAGHSNVDVVYYHRHFRDAYDWILKKIARLENDEDVDSDEY